MTSSVLNINIFFSWMIVPILCLYQKKKLTNLGKYIRYRPLKFMGHQWPIDAKGLTAGNNKFSHLNSDIAPVSSKEFLDIQATIACGFALKRVRDMIRTYRQNNSVNGAMVITMNRVINSFNCTRNLYLFWQFKIKRKRINK